MAKAFDKLTPLAIKAAGIGKHFDGLGLYLEIQTPERRYWRLKYRFAGREKRLALGVYPEVTLGEARARRDKARSQLRDGIDPGEAKKDLAESEQRKARGKFATVAEDWLTFKRKGWAPETARKAEFVMARYLLPALRGQSITTLNSKDAARVIGSIAESAPNLAAKARQYLGGMVTYAMQQGLRDDGRLLALRGAVPRIDKGNIPAATTPAEIVKLLHALDAYDSPVTRAALTLAMLTAMRPGIVASARWAEFDLKAAEWHVPADKMKTRNAHIVSLPKQALALLEDMQAYTAGKEYVFPPLARQHSKHLHRDALSAALRRMGFRGLHATHGFRGMLRTAGRERLGIDPDVLEAQLAHAKKGEVQKAYDRTTFNIERRSAMQRWADWLDTLRREDKVTVLKRRDVVS
jgi:integrase